jgi:hypothetical protein
MFLRDLLRDQAEDGRIDVEEIEIDGRYAVLPRQNGSDHVVAYQSEFDEIKSQSATVFALVVEGLSQVLRANKIFAYQDFA